MSSHIKDNMKRMLIKLDLCVPKTWGEIMCDWYAEECSSNHWWYNETQDEKNNK